MVLKPYFKEKYMPYYFYRRDFFVVKLFSKDNLLYTNIF